MVGVGRAHTLQFLLALLHKLLIEEACESGMRRHKSKKTIRECDMVPLARGKTQECAHRLGGTAGSVPARFGNAVSS